MEPLIERLRTLAAQEAVTDADLEDLDDSAEPEVTWVEMKEMSEVMEAAADRIAALVAALSALVDKLTMCDGAPLHFCDVCRAHAIEDASGPVTTRFDHYDDCEIVQARSVLAAIRGATHA